MDSLDRKPDSLVTIRKKKSVASFNCQYCDTTYSSRSKHCKHLIDVHNATLMCSFCSEQFVADDSKAMSALDEHLILHEQTHNWSCIYCDFRACSRRSIMAHLEHGFHDKIQCGTCKEYMPLQTVLYMHRKTCSGKNIRCTQFKCGRCSESFHTQDEVVAHVCPYVTSETRGIAISTGRRCRPLLALPNVPTKKQRLSVPTSLELKSENLDCPKFSVSDFNSLLNTRTSSSMATSAENQSFPPATTKPQINEIPFTKKQQKRLRRKQRLLQETSKGLKKLANKIKHAQISSAKKKPKSKKNVVEKNLTQRKLCYTCNLCNTKTNSRKEIVAHLKNCHSVRVKITSSCFTYSPVTVSGQNKAAAIKFKKPKCTRCKIYKNKNKLLTEVLTNIRDQLESCLTL